ncbi:MAG: phosphoribosylformylglycinamidine synthase subunit PurL [Armatimonadetes bacterium]|nr:phosphoribosylformylglycinamidine synthase subunit PurL [Armatimonadota bacterium]
MLYRVEVATKTSFKDAAAEGLKADIEELGIGGVWSARISQVYRLEGEITPEELARISQELLFDPIIQEVFWEGSLARAQAGQRVLEVAYNPGVMDPAEDSVLKGIRDLGIGGVHSVKTARKYVFEGSLSDADIENIADRLLVNKTIQHATAEGEHAALPAAEYRFCRIEAPLLEADDRDLERISKDGHLWLNLQEMEAIRGYFRNLGRNPSDVEMETLAQTWSEHCGHKTFRGKINFNGQIIDNLLKSTIMKATQEMDKSWCLSIFRDNAGVIEFDDRWAVCMKVETHNHPSALEPYGGASTGIGGAIRDPMGTGLGAKPFANTNVFCFAPPDMPYDRLPKGTLHPKRVFKGVRAGVADYGNRMGIPTVNGAILFDERYVGNPLVYCGNLGLMPKDCAQRGQQKPGDLVVLVGGRTGRDGIHGATFSSGDLSEESEVISSGSVQIGNAITEKKMVDTLLQARDRKLYSRITDVGGGGLSSAVGEMGADTGVKVYLERVPLKYAGLSYTEIWISEAQERMIIAVPPGKLDELMQIFADEDVEATVIGEFTDSGRLELFYEGHLVCDLDMAFLHEGTPQLERAAVWVPPAEPESDFAQPENLTASLKAILSSWNVCSKEWVIRQYDHEVQGGSVLKPLVGAAHDGPGDASIVRPILSSERGVIVSCGINPRYSDLDPYCMAASAIDEALRQIIAVGGSLERVALLDNFCWGNTNKPDRLGSLVRAAQACHDFSLHFGTPFISGKDSLNNEYEVGGESICIPGTLLVSAMAVIPDVKKAISMDAKAAGNLIYMIGATYDETGGSHYRMVRNASGGEVPKVRETAKAIMETLSRATGMGLVRSCHDCSEGGLGVAAAEMAFAGGLGMRIDLSRVPLGEAIDREDAILFSESNTRFVAEIEPDIAAAFEEALAGIPCACIGEVVAEPVFTVTGRTGQVLAQASLAELKDAWQKPLKW